MDFGFAKFNMKPGELLYAICGTPGMVIRLELFLAKLTALYRIHGYANTSSVKIG